MSLQEIMELADKLKQLKGKVFSEEVGNSLQLVVRFGNPSDGKHRKFPISLDMLSRQSSIEIALPEIDEKSTELKSRN